MRKQGKLTARDQEMIYDRFWREVAKERIRPFSEYKMDLIRRRIPGGRDSRALDIGCGDGFFTFKLLEMGYRVDAMDVSAESVKLIEEKIQRAGRPLPLKLFRSDIFSFAPGEKYDLIFLLETLEHIEDDRGTLARIGGWLKEDGLLVISVPHNPSLWSAEDDIGGHLRRYTREDLRAKITGANLRLTKLLCYGFPFIRFFQFHVLLPRREKAGLEVYSAGSSSRIMARLIRFLCNIDSLFPNSRWGTVIIAVCGRR